MVQRILGTSLVLLAAAACGDTPAGPSFDADRPTVVAAADQRVSICHRDADDGLYLPITINGRAEDAHRNHGDGQVGDPVPGMEGYDFDETCQPQPATRPVSACLAAGIAAWDLKVGLGVPGPWDWDSFGPWSPLASSSTAYSISGGEFIVQVDSSVGRTTCSFTSVFGLTASGSVPFDDFEASRAFLQSLATP